MILWRLAFRNLLRQKRRDLATLTAIALGFVGMLMVAGYAYRVENYLRVYTLYLARVGHLTIMKEGSLDQISLKPKQFSLSAEEQIKIERAIAPLSSIEFFGKQLQGTGMIGNGCATIPFLATGIEPQVAEKLQKHSEIQKWMPERISLHEKTLNDYPPSLGAIEVSIGMARLLHKPFVYNHFSENPSPLRVIDCQSRDMKSQLAADSNVQLLASSNGGLLSAIDGQIVAHFSTGFKETDDSAILTSVEHLQKLYGVYTVSSYSIWLKDPTQLKINLDEIREKIRKEKISVDIIPWTDERLSPVYTGTLQFIFTLVGFIVIVLACVVSFSILNSITMTITERSQEVGMFRSLGFTRFQIRQLFLTEALLLIGIGLSTGGILGFAAMKVINLVNIRFQAPGMVGDIQLLLIPHRLNTILLASMLVILSLAITWVAIYQQSKRGITELLNQTQS